MSAKPYNTFNCAACGNLRILDGSAVRVMFGRRTRICGRCKVIRALPPKKEPTK